MQKDKIVKFKNGNITIYNYSDFYDSIDGYYYNEITMHDLYIEFFEDLAYIIDYNTQKVYNLYIDYYTNPLIYLNNELKTHGKIKLYPLSKKEAYEILNSTLEN